jgi:hypothetical protein
MHHIALVTSVPDLHTARILASAGVPYISFQQEINNLPDIQAWLEGPEIGIQIENPELSLPQVDFLIVKDSDYDLYSFSGKKIFWLTTDVHWTKPYGALLNVSPPVDHLQVTVFNKYAAQFEDVDHSFRFWLDCIDDATSFDRIFLS